MDALSFHQIEGFRSTQGLEQNSHGRKFQSKLHSINLTTNHSPFVLEPKPYPECL